MLVDELIDDLRWKVNPDVKDSIFTLLFESLKQVFLYVAHDSMRSAKVELVPLSIGLPVADALLTDGPVG